MQSLRQRRELRARLRHDFQRRDPAGTEIEAKTTLDVASNDLNGIDTNQDEIENSAHHKSTPVTIPPPVYLSNERYNNLLNPRSWSVRSRWIYTGIIAFTGCLVSYASSNAAPTVPQAMQEHSVSEEVALLACTTYFITFGIGTMVAAPLTEVYGRNPVYIISMVLFALFSIGSALAPDIQTQVVFRGFMGLFASTPLVTIGGSIGDLWWPLDRTYVFPIFACFFFISSFIAPLIGDAIAVSPVVSWHFTEWITFIWAILIVVLFISIMPETYGPVLLGWKVSFLRELLNDAGHDTAFLDNMKVPYTNWKAMVRTIGRPIFMLMVEPVLDLFALYLVLLWVVLFGFLPGYGYIFGKDGIYGLDQMHTGLCFMPINVGFLFSLVPIFPLYRRFKTKLTLAERCGDGQVPPEERLVLSMIGAPFLPIGMFWLGWAARPTISLWLPLVGGTFTGFATITIFVSCIQYLIDAFETYTASALVGMTLTRYVIAGPMVIVSVPMYRNLGHHWALTILGGIAMVMTAVPYIFYYYGARIRKMSRNMRHDT